MVIQLHDLILRFSPLQNELYQITNVKKSQYVNKLAIKQAFFQLPFCSYSETYQRSLKDYCGLDYSKVLDMDSMIDTEEQRLAQMLCDNFISSKPVLQQCVHQDSQNMVASSKDTNSVFLTGSMVPLMRKLAANEAHVIDTVKKHHRVISDINAFKTNTSYIEKGIQTEDLNANISVVPSLSKKYIVQSTFKPIERKQLHYPQRESALRRNLTTHTSLYQ